MQFQSDILDINVQCPQTTEATALGAAYLAGLAAGVWKNTGELMSRRKISRRFTPNMDDAKRRTLLSGWAKAVQRCLQWEDA